MSTAQALGWSHEAFESATLFKLLLAATNWRARAAALKAEADKAREMPARGHRRPAEPARATVSISELLARKAAETKARGVTHG